MYPMVLPRKWYQHFFKCENMVEQDNINLKFLRINYNYLFKNVWMAIIIGFVEDIGAKSRCGLELKEI